MLFSGTSRWLPSPQMPLVSGVCVRSAKRHLGGTKIYLGLPHSQIQVAPALGAV